MSKKPLAYPTIRLDASGESFDELTHVDVIHVRIRRNISLSQMLQIL